MGMVLWLAVVLVLVWHARATPVVTQVTCRAGLYGMVLACGADSLERGVDEYRVKVLVGEEDGSRQYDTGPGSSPHHQHDLTLQEESFAARLRAAKQHQQL
jgi:hypothetical protein